jgi:hypothetical protein
MSKGIAFVLFAVAVVLQSHGQVVESVHVRLEVMTNKKIYSVGEPIRWRAILVNSGESGSAAFYVSKTLGYDGGYIPGFDVSVRQLSGTPPKGPGCGVARDGLRRKPGRTPEEILKGDFILLPPGGLVGFETEYAGCDVRGPGRGKYKIVAYYYTADEARQYSSDELNVQGAHILTGRYKSAPFIFTVR